MTPWRQKVRQKLDHKCPSESFKRVHLYPVGVGTKESLGTLHQDDDMMGLACHNNN